VKVSVIVPAFNSERSLEAAVQSLLATGYGDLEILVVDDGSTDGTLEKASQLALQHPGVVRVLTHPGSDHRGVSATRNLGILASSGELIAFLDADDVVLPNRFNTSVPMLRDRVDVDGIYELTRIDNRSQSGADVVGQWRDGSIFGIDAPCYGEELLKTLMRGIPWGVCAFLCRRTLFDRIGLFQEGRAMAEDCHLWIRAVAGANILPAVPLQAVCLYVRHGANSYSYSLERRLDLLDAMADAGGWIREHAFNEWCNWRCLFADYLARTMIAAREAGCLGIVFRGFQLCMRYRLYSVIADRRVARQLTSATAGCFRSRWIVQE